MMIRTSEKRYNLTQENSDTNTIGVARMTVIEEERWKHKSELGCSNIPSKIVSMENIRYDRYVK